MELLNQTPKVKWLLLFALAIAMPILGIPLLILYFVLPAQMKSQIAGYTGSIRQNVLFMALLLSICSAFVFSAANEYITYLGFPLSFVTFYNYPVTVPTTETIWQNFHTKLNINILNFVLNSLIYYLFGVLLLKLVGTVWSDNRSM